MGSPELETSSPQITVYLDAYWIDQTEVTNAMYQKFVESGACTLPRYLTWWSDSKHEYYVLEMHADYLVISVDKNQSQAYCEWVGRSLPTEANGKGQREARTDEHIHGERLSLMIMQITVMAVVAPQK